MEVGPGFEKLRWLPGYKKLEQLEEAERDSCTCTLWRALFAGVLTGSDTQTL